MGEGDCPYCPGPPHKMSCESPGRVVLPVVRAATGALTVMSDVPGERRNCWTCWHRDVLHDLTRGCEPECFEPTATWSHRLRSVMDADGMPPRETTPCPGWAEKEE